LLFCKIGLKKRMNELRRNNKGDNNV